jgi:hypothetical protein
MSEQSASSYYPFNVVTNSSSMDLRDYFAAKAMAAMLARDEAFENPDKCAAWAYEQADAMLKARAGVQP